MIYECVTAPHFPLFPVYKAWALEDHQLDVTDGETDPQIVLNAPASQIPVHGGALLYEVLFLFSFRN